MPWLQAGGIQACLPLTSLSIPAAEGARCTDPPAGKPTMAAKRKGGLKLNAICAKLSRQVVVEKGAEAGSHTEGSPLRSRDKERGGAEPGVARAPRSEEDKRRAVIEKWVNGEYSEEPGPVPISGRLVREGLELPPEGVYMVQPQGCSDEEDHSQELSKDGSVIVEEKDLDRVASKDDSSPRAKQASGGYLRPAWRGPGGRPGGEAAACAQSTLLPSLCLQGRHCPDPVRTPAEGWAGPRELPERGRWLAARGWGLR